VSGKLGDDVDWSVDSLGEYLAYTGAVLLIGVFFGLVVWASYPTLDLQVRGVLEEPANYTGEEIVFDESQIRELNKLYEERLEEYGWCLEVADETVVELRHPLRVSNSTETHVETRCPVISNGHLHTHPGSLSGPELSRTDKLTLLQSFEVMCVMADPVPGYETQRPVGLNCYDNPYDSAEIESEDEAVKRLNQTEFQQVEVRIDW